MQISTHSVSPSGYTVEIGFNRRPFSVKLTLRPVGVTIVRRWMQHYRFLLKRIIRVMISQTSAGWNSSVRYFTEKNASIFISQGFPEWWKKFSLTLRLIFYQHPCRDFVFVYWVKYHIGCATPGTSRSGVYEWSLHQGTWDPAVSRLWEKRQTFLTLQPNLYDRVIAEYHELGWTLKRPLLLLPTTVPWRLRIWSLVFMILMRHVSRRVTEKLVGGSYIESGGLQAEVSKVLITGLAALARYCITTVFASARLGTADECSFGSCQCCRLGVRESCGDDVYGTNHEYSDLRFSSSFSIRTIDTSDFIRNESSPFAKSVLALKERRLFPHDFPRRIRNICRDLVKANENRAAHYLHIDWANSMLTYSVEPYLILCVPQCIRFQACPNVRNSTRIQIHPI